VNFFEDELARLGYDWREVVAEYLFDDKEPMFNSIMGGRMFPSFLKGILFPKF
jgi:hypothetical protein